MKPTVMFFAILLTCGWIAWKCTGPRDRTRYGTRLKIRLLSEHCKDARREYGDDATELQGAA